MRKLFGKPEETTVSVEENVEAIALEQDAVIAHEEESREFDAIANEVNEDIDFVASVEDAVVTLEASVAAGETKLENPETVTAADAFVSNEELNYNARLLGADLPEMIGDNVVSHESAIAEPVTALTISNENAKEFVSKVVDKLKEIFAKIMQVLKKLVAKGSAVMVKNGDSAEKLAKQLEGLGDKAEGEFNESEVKALQAKFGAAYAGKGKDIKGADLVSMLKAISSYKVLEDVSKLAEGSIAAIEKGDADGIKAAMDKLYSLDGVKAAPGFDKLVDAKSKDVKGLPEAGEGEEVAVLPFRADGSTVKAIVTVTKEGAAPKVSVGTLTFDAKTYDKELMVMSKGDIQSVLKELASVGKDAKKYSDSVMKIVDGNSKAIDKLAKLGKGDELSAEQKEAINAVSKFLSTSVANMGIDMVLGNVYGARAVLVTASKHVAKFKGGKPVEKDEE